MDICKDSDTFNKLVNHKMFSAIANDVKKGGKIMVEGAKSKGENIYNCLGKPICKNEPLSKVTAHMLQGVEAQALDSVLLDLDVAVSLHDGYVFYEKVNPAYVEKVISMATGYNLTLDYEAL